MTLRPRRLSAALVFLLVPAAWSGSKHDCASMPEMSHCQKNDYSGEARALRQPLSDDPSLPGPTLPPLGPRKAPANEFLGLEAIQAHRAKMQAQFPDYWNGKVVAGTLDDGLAGKVTQADLDLFGRYMPLRSELSKIYWGNRQRGDPRPEQLEELGDRERDAFVARFKARLPDKERREFSRLIAELDPVHDSIMQTPLHAHLMNSDRAARFFMGDPVKHDETWTDVSGDAAQPWQYRARQELLNGDPRRALADAQKALDLDPSDAKSLSLIAAAQFELKQFQAAVETAQAALRLDPDDAMAQAVSRLAHASPEGTRLPAAAPAAPAAGAAEGVPVEVLAGMSFKPAALLPHPREASVLARQAERALGLGDFGAAIGYASRALGVDPGFAHALGLRAFAHGKAGNSDQALKDAMAGLKLNPRDKMSLNARAQALNRLGRYQEALAASRQASSANSRNSFARYMEAVAHSGLGDRGGMLSALQAAGKIDTRYQEIYEAALQAPQDSDMALLFPQEKSMVAASRRGMRWAAVLAAALAGGGLLAFGFFRLAFVPLRSAFTRARPGPARGQYKTLKQIGAGGMGMVYEGKDVSLDRRVAIKKMREEIRLDGRQRERFITEAKLVAALHHPNVVDIYSIIDEGDELALVFEFVSGKTLHQLICERRRLGLPEAMAIFKGVAGALDYAHGRGIIHRDLKPSNIMITDEGAAKVMDFGIARAAKDALARQSMTNTVVGTPPYMAPEQEQGVVRRESDVYALAVCFYEMICGQLPFSGSGGGMLMSKINKSYVAASRVVPGLPESLDAVIDRALDPDPERRYRCAQDLLAGLESGSVSSAV